MRPYHHNDRAAVLALNNDAIPAVNELDAAALDQLVEWCESTTVAITDDRVVGFLVCLTGPGLSYPSDNYQWLSQRYDPFLYVDRVVVHPEAKGAGVGQALYRHIVEQGRGRFPVLVAEVNVRPRNDASIRFHERFGFETVGEADTEGGAKRVAYFALPLPLAP